MAVKPKLCLFLPSVMRHDLHWSRIRIFQNPPLTHHTALTDHCICPQAVAKLNQTPNGHRMKLKFLQYAQSSQCRTPADSSVSYASASLIFE